MTVANLTDSAVIDPTLCGVGSVLSIRRHGSGTCQDPQGSVPVRRPDGNVDQVSVSWTLTQCNLKTGVFRIFVQPGNYHVSFLGYPLTLPSNAEVGGTNCP